MKDIDYFHVCRRCSYERNILSLGEFEELVLLVLKKKGFVKSKKREPMEERGGRRKRIFLPTASGKRALTESNKMSNQCFNRIARIAFQFKLV